MAELSRAAQAIVQAFNDRYELCGPLEDDWHEQCLAAALEALADQLAPESQPTDSEEWLGQSAWLQAQQGVRFKILVITAQLRGGQADG